MDERKSCTAPPPPTMTLATSYISTSAIVDVYCKRLMYCIQLPSPIPFHLFRTHSTMLQCMAHYHPQMVFAQPTIQAPVLQSRPTQHSSICSVPQDILSVNRFQRYILLVLHSSVLPLPLPLKKTHTIEIRAQGWLFRRPASNHPKMSHPARETERKFFICKTATYNNKKKEPPLNGVMYFILNKWASSRFTSIFIFFYFVEKKRN